MIPIMRPKLPCAERLTPYLRTIDSSRTYSNFGPLAVSLEDRLAGHYGLGSGRITTVANATLGLTLALSAQGVRPGALCLMPAWTFIASAHAALMAGLVPYFVDVDPRTWALDIAAMPDAIARAPAEVGAVMPVVPFGRPIDVAAWDGFRSRTGLPVVIDAATGFDSLSPGATPAVVSLHATKVYGTGEGGFVISTDSSIVRDVRTRSNFGFESSRLARIAAANAKLSEYHAAVGHAALDEWPVARAEWFAAAQAYRARFRGATQVQLQKGFGETWVASTCVVSLADEGAARAETALAKAGVDTRRWWGDGAHTHPATAACPRTALPTTEALARSALAVPFYRDLGGGEIGCVADLVLAASGA